MEYQINEKKLYSVLRFTYALLYIEHLRININCRIVKNIKICFAIPILIFKK